MNPLRQEKLRQLKLELREAEEQILELEHFSDNCFAAACYNNNSISDLEESSLMEADATDCTIWNITPDEWLHAIQLVIETKRQELVITNLEKEIAILED